MRKIWGAVALSVGLGLVLSACAASGVPESTKPQNEGETVMIEQGIGAATATAPLPEGFVYLRQAVPEVLQDIRYAGHDNFIGAPIDGYEAAEAILTRAAAEALAQVAADLQPLGLRLLVYDGYRPQRAVDHFVRWSSDANDTAMKAAYYPREDKARLFARGYIAKKSGHSRGSTVDLTLVDESGAPLDMGTGFDFMDERSAHGAAGLTRQQRENRQILRQAMEARGFRAYSAEWWHYTIKDEPFPDQHFDFVISPLPEKTAPATFLPQP